VIVPGSTPTLREQLLEARAKVEKQIDRLRARPYPYADVGPFGAWMSGMGGLFRANGVMIDNSELITRLTQVLGEIDEASRGLRSAD
jgi:hypothetical protein